MLTPKDQISFLAEGRLQYQENLGNRANGALAQIEFMNFGHYNSRLVGQVRCPDGKALSS